MILHGNNIEVLKTFPDNYFHSVCTDPNYGLGKEPDPMDVMKDWIEKGYHTVKNKGGFMGKEWDAFVPQPILWKEVYRVLKPGGHMLVACGTRTQDWMAMSLRFGGFEIRDVITWHYGQGFPKSRDISKDIDKEAGAEREVIGEKITGKAGTRADKRNANEGFESGNMVVDITAPATEAAKTWSGWGSALKPATEFWTLCRKPLSESTIAGNVLKHGTGGLNIDQCRIDTDEIITNHSRGALSAISKGKYGDSEAQETHQTNGQQLGRFPSNLIFSCDCQGPHEPGCPVGELDRQSGALKSGVAVGGKGNAASIYGSKIEKHKSENQGYFDTGTASRFFYVAKASKAERNKGLHGMEKKESGIKNESGRGFSEGDPYKKVLNENSHPTVKPVTLMRYLCRLITPPKGIILDPFNGSGSTGVAAALEWFEYVGIEQDESHVKVSEKRKPPPDLFT